MHAKTSISAILLIKLWKKKGKRASRGTRKAEAGREVREARRWQRTYWQEELGLVFDVSGYASGPPFLAEAENLGLSSNQERKNNVQTPTH